MNNSLGGGDKGRVPSYGEPLVHVPSEFGSMVRGQFGDLSIYAWEDIPIELQSRMVECTNACTGIPDPSVIRELVEELRSLANKWDQRSRVHIRKAHVAKEPERTQQKLICGVLVKLKDELNAVLAKLTPQGDSEGNAGSVEGEDANR